MIYFIHDTETNRVKIGYSAQPWARFSKLQSDSPGELSLLAILEGEPAEEREFHAQFSADRIRGEWFRLSADLKAFLEKQVRPTKPRRLVGPRSPKEFARLTGFSKAYASMLLSGAKVPNLSLALKIFRDTGLQIGPIADAPKEDMIVLSRWADRIAA